MTGLALRLPNKREEHHDLLYFEDAITGMRKLLSCRRLPIGAEDGHLWGKVVLLWGGDKRTQAADIKRAQTYWAEYKKR